MATSECVEAGSTHQKAGHYTMHVPFVDAREWISGKGVPACLSVRMGLTGELSFLCC